jgi:hypothetical protein
MGIISNISIPLYFCTTGWDIASSLFVRTKRQQETTGPRCQSSWIYIYHNIVHASL